MKYIFLSQGIYYTITGAWTLLDIKSFSRFTGYYGDFFLKHTAGVLFFILGLLFLYVGFVAPLRKHIRPFALATALGIMIVAIYYLPLIGNPLPFWIDFGIEGVIAISFLISYVFEKI